MTDRRADSPLWPMTGFVDARPNLPPLRPPLARGPLSAWVLDRLGAQRYDHATSPASRDDLDRARGQGLGDDAQLALFLCYESHFSDLPGVRSDHEWDPVLLAFRCRLEALFEAALADLVGGGVREPNRRWGRRPRPVRELLPEIIAADDGPSLSRYMETAGTLDQMRQLVVHRSAYQLKEGDGHTFALPRVSGPAKQHLVTIQAGEYGAEAPGQVPHAELFARTMVSLGLDPRPHAYLDQLPASALLISNLVSLFGLHRRWRGALVGHLAMFEMTSVEPMGRYARALERLGAGPDASRFYEVHVLADAEHEVMALDMAQALADGEPDLASDIVYGARCGLASEAVFAGDLLRRWHDAGARKAA